MKSIQRRYGLFKTRYPDLGDFTVLMKTVKGQHYTKNTISRWFEKLVEKDDYSKEDKKHLMDNLLKLTNWPEDHSFKG